LIASRKLRGFGVLGLLAALTACGGSAAAPSSASPSALAKPSVAPASAAATAKPAAAASASAKPAASGPAAASGSAAGNVTEFNYGISAIAGGALPTWIAQKHGFDTKNGLKLNVINAEGGSRGLQILLGGQLQAMEVGLAPVVISNSNGANFRLITSTENFIPFIFFGAKGITAGNAAQKLKGGKIGISTFGSESDVAASMYIEKLGLVRDKDVTVVQVPGSSAARLSGVVSGSLSAAPLTAAQVVQAKDQGLQPLIDLSKNSSWVFDGAVVDKTFADAHQDMYLALAKTLVEGNFYARAHPDEGKQILGEQNKTTDQNVIDATYQEFLDGPLDLKPTAAGIQEVLKQVPALTQTKLKSQNPSDYVDTTLLDKLQASGFTDQMRKQYNISASAPASGSS